MTIYDKLDEISIFQAFAGRVLARTIPKTYHEHRVLLFQNHELQPYFRLDRHNWPRQTFAQPQLRGYRPR